MGCKVPAFKTSSNAGREQILATEKSDSSQMSTEIFFLLIDIGFCRTKFFLGENNQDWGLAFGGAGYPDFRAYFGPKSLEPPATICYNTLMLIFHCLATGFGLLLSIAAFIFVLTWQRQRGQVLMLAFVFTGLILPQLLDLLLNIDMVAGGPSSSSDFWIYQMVATLTWTSHLIGSGLLLGYAIYLALAKPQPVSRLSQRNIDMPHRYEQSDLQHDSAAIQTSSLPSRGPQWNVPPAPKLNVKILRQREWGFLIDFMPFVFGIFVLLLIYGSRLNSSGFSSHNFDTQLFAIVWLLVALQFCYALFKDCAGGRSLGKHFTGCRVVDLKTGKPAPAGQTILRNLPFLIPFFSIVELATASLRPDSRRWGDLLAGTIVVTGPPDFFDGEPVAPPETASPEPVKKHPLDD